MRQYNQCRWRVYTCAQQVGTFPHQLVLPRTTKKFKKVIAQKGNQKKTQAHYLQKVTAISGEGNEYLDNLTKQNQIKDGKAISLKNNLKEEKKKKGYL